MLPLLFVRDNLVDIERMPDQCSCKVGGENNCEGMSQLTKTADFEKDIDDIANSTMKVMCVCKLQPWEVNRAKNLIKRSFRHYEEIRQRVDRVPVKRFNKENFLHDLAVDAGMSRLDAQLAYGVVKRAFKAYYHGTGEGGRRLISLMNRMRHRTECLWLHAARRTAQIYAAYAGLMYSEMKQYEACIVCIYKNLFDQLQTRLVYEDNPPAACTCTGITDNKSKRNPNPPKTQQKSTRVSDNTIQTTEIFFNKQTFKLSKPTSALTVQLALTATTVEINKRSNTSVDSSRTKKRKRKKCSCLAMECVQGQPPPRITAECSQGPYTCRWVSYEEEETFPEHRVPCPPIQDICPICEDIPCDPDCTCTCEVCTCKPAYLDFAEEEHAEKLSASGLEDYDTDFCYLAPFRDWPRVEKVKQTNEAMTESELGDEEAMECRCTCEMARRAQPHLFTYLMPFDGDRRIPEPEPSEDVIKTIKPPPFSISTYRCWTNQQEEADNEESSPCKQCPTVAILEWDAHGRYGRPIPDEDDTAARLTTSPKRRTLSKSGRKSKS